MTASANCRPRLGRRRYRVASLACERSDRSPCQPVTPSQNSAQRRPPLNHDHHRNCERCRLCGPDPDHDKSRMLTWISASASKLPAQCERVVGAEGTYVPANTCWQGRREGGRKGRYIASGRAWRTLNGRTAVPGAAVSSPPPHPSPLAMVFSGCTGIGPARTRGSIESAESVGSPSGRAEA